MYLWIGLGLEQNDEKEIRDYCKEINKDIKVSEQSFTLPQHISLKQSFYTNDYLSVIEEYKKLFKDQEEQTLIIKDAEMIPGLIYIEIKETNFLRESHNKILTLLKEKYNIDKVGFDGDGFKFHSTLFQDIDNKDKFPELYSAMDSKKFKDKEIKVSRVYFGISDIGKVGTFNVIDYIDLKEKEMIKTR